MLKPQLNLSQSIKTLLPLSKPFPYGTGRALRPAQATPLFKRGPNIRVGSAPSSNIIKAVAITTEKSSQVKAVVTVKKNVLRLLATDVEDLLGKSLLLELVSTELDPKTGSEKPTIKGYARKAGNDDEGDVQYALELEIPTEFGEVGAVLVENEHREEMYLKNIVLDGFPNGPVNIACGSWVHSKYNNKQKRVFFANRLYLPSETPNGLRRIRAEELVSLRGNGQGERRGQDRIYDYDVYNDLGDPDSNVDLARPVLGGEKRPYPRRCRTGRPRCEKDPLSETRSLNFYVPRDEGFSNTKEASFVGKTIYSALQGLVPYLGSVSTDAGLGFVNFKAIDSLFEEGIDLPQLHKEGFLGTLISRLVKAVKDTTEDVLRFETPEALNRDQFFWLKDEEFARQTLAGLNPYSIQLITEWPLKSSLDPQIYGPQESKITTELIEKDVGGMMTVDEAIKQKRLFILDYHDLLLPYVEKVRQIKGTTLYGSRTIFFLTPDGKLRPLAIELTRPPMDGKLQWQEVFTPTDHSTDGWLWMLAKAHVLAHDSGYHELVSHWLRTHCCSEPYIIATNRQLSVMHPIYRLLHPHFRYTMEINARARQALISGGGIIEGAFSPGKYSMELSSVVYDKQWRFDHQALPKDLINRGMAVEDPSAPHYLKLMIEDYPFANDGLILWDAMKQWVTDFVSHYYPDANLIESDEELQAWWTEIRTVGHGDKKDKPWWPILKTPEDLIEIITTIIWVASAHHAAVNFGQYTYGGYFPNRPTIARVNMPTEDPNDEELWKLFLEKPEVALLTTFPSQIQAITVMVVLDLLSNHSPDEEYLGEFMDPAWGEDPVIEAAFQRFSGRLKELEGIIDGRNADSKFKNRNGAGIVPYELLKPHSKPGVTGKGVPYSISI